MNIELSRRVAKIMNVIYSELSFEDYTEFVQKISRAKSFDKLPTFYKQLIIDAEKK